MKETKDIYPRDIWIVSSVPRRADILKSIIPDDSYRFTMFDTNDAALAKMESISYRRERKPDLVITDETLNRRKDGVEEEGSGRAVADAFNDKKVPTIVLPMDKSLELEDFQKKFIDDVKAALARNKLFGLLAKRSESLVRR